MQKVSYTTVIKGSVASASLLGFYFIISSLLGGLEFARTNFLQLWYWMIPLIIGFGVQIGMFFHIKESMHKKAIAPAAASTGVSTTSMVACCAHHLADIAPFLGITAAATFLTKYQSSLLLIGIVSNILGITFMASLMSKRVSRHRMRTILYVLLAVAIVIIIVSFYSTATAPLFQKPKTEASKKTRSFETITQEKNSVTFEVTPSTPSAFAISVNTHSVTLDFDMVQIATLYDDSGASYKPLKWEGAPPGGHHREGTLYFPTINPAARSIKLVIIDSALREFSWSLDE